MENNQYQVWRKIQTPINDREFLVGRTMARELHQKDYHDIAVQYIFITPQDVEKTLKILPGAWESFTGAGIDLGGGIACVSSIIAKKKDVQSVHCVEYTEDLVKLCQPVFKKAILGEQAGKVISVVGDFNNLELDDNSLDFAVSWDSIHHSYEPIHTLRECHRVLKKGGKLVLVDRAHNNSTPDSEIQRMLAIVYDKEYLKKNYLDENMTLTRSDNGEHEWRYRELDHFFQESRFKLISRVSLKTDNHENRQLKNDVGDLEIFVPFNVGGFGHRKVGFVLEAI
jgi:ubiquinone/menaquinone biosynthesis C-methylase UbiE